DRDLRRRGKQLHDASGRFASAVLEDLAHVCPAGRPTGLETLGADDGVDPVARQNPSMPLLRCTNSECRHEWLVASPNCCKSPKSRQGHGVGSPKSCKTKKGDLRREENATAVGGDRGTDRPAACRRGRREPQRVAL